MNCSIIHLSLWSSFWGPLHWQRNPALKIALDYSHYVAQGYQPADVDPLVPYAGHVHLRQACRGQLQAR